MIIQGDHADGTWVLEIFPLDQMSVGHLYLILHITSDPAPGQHCRSFHRPGEGLIGELVGTQDDHRWSLSTGSRVASLRSSAASTRPMKSGCGLVGRDLSSGCAWVATKYG